MKMKKMMMRRRRSNEKFIVRTPAKYYWGDQKEGEYMGGACSTGGEE
jgi:hypothetical protein